MIPQGQKTVRGAHFGSERKSMTVKSAETLQRGDRFHDWMDLARRRICCGDKATWLCLWDNPPRVPKAMSIEERVALLLGESEEETVEENNVPAPQAATSQPAQTTTSATTNTRSRSVNSSSSSQQSDSNATATNADATKVEMLKREAVK